MCWKFFETPRKRLKYAVLIDNFEGPQGDPWSQNFFQKSFFPIANSGKQIVKKFQNFSFGKILHESNFYSAPRAKRGGPNKLFQGALTRGDFVFIWESKKTTFWKLLITQARDNIFNLSKRLKLTTHYILLTGAIETLTRGDFVFIWESKKTTYWKLLITQARDNIFKHLLVLARGACLAAQTFTLV